MNEEFTLLLSTLEYLLAAPQIVLLFLFLFKEMLSIFKSADVQKLIFVQLTYY